MGTSNFKRLPHGLPLFVCLLNGKEITEEVKYRTEEYDRENPDADPDDRETEIEDIDSNVRNEYIEQAWEDVAAVLDRIGGIAGFTFSLRAGYYESFQLYAEYDAPDVYSDADPSPELLAAARAVLAYIAKECGLTELNIVGTFSNGETVYQLPKKSNVLKPAREIWERHGYTWDKTWKDDESPRAIIATLASVGEHLEVNDFEDEDDL